METHVENVENVENAILGTFPTSFQFVTLVGTKSDAVCYRRYIAKRKQAERYRVSVTPESAEPIFQEALRMETINPNQFYTQDEIRRVLKISTKRITQAIESQALKGRILGRRRIVLGKHLIEWLTTDPQDRR
jgi:hypothetical protein